MNNYCHLCCYVLLVIVFCLCLLSLVDISCFHSDKIMVLFYIHPPHVEFCPFRQSNKILLDCRKKLRLPKQTPLQYVSMFSILSWPQSPHRPIQVYQNVILDFQQLGLKSVTDALLLRSNGVQSDPAFTMQHSKRSQKSFLGSDFLTIFSVCTHDIMYIVIVIVIDINGPVTLE